jgi:Domain of unknown function DUF29
MSGEVGLYEEDFVRWAEAQAAGLRRAAETNSNLPLDWMNLAEEVESLGRSQRRELRGRLANIIEHLLKLEYSPRTEPRIGWLETIGGSGAKSSVCLKTARVSEANSSRRSRPSGTARRGSSPKF